MLLVTRIIGTCPECRADEAFGNVSVSGDTLFRGCLRCKYSERLRLPPLSKEVLYLDQFFLSHAFRAELSEFVDATKLIAELAHAQLLVCPYSSIHETETHQWRHAQQQRLWEFIKQISRGRTFESEYRVKLTQISRGFERFMASVQEKFPLEIHDALPRNLNDWDDYFRIEVPHSPDNVELVRELKTRSIDELVNLFPDWRKTTTTFEEDRRLESEAAGRVYLEHYLRMTGRIAGGDFMATLDSPVDTLIVESLMSCDRDALDFEQRLNRVIAYFRSAFFEEVPCEWISAGLFAVLKDRVKRGQYQNTEKAKERLGGLFYDVQFIAAYAPYCQAMFVDNTMCEFVDDRRIGLTGRFGTRVFARNRWDDFMTYLESVRSRRSPELERALRLVHP